jgi:hypothetical protein
VLLGALWLLASAPALLVPFWYYWVAGAAAVSAAGWPMVVRRRRQLRQQVLGHWDSLSCCAQDAKAVQARCIEEARAAYQRQMEESKERARVQLEAHANRLRQMTSKVVAELNKRQVDAEQKCQQRLEELEQEAREQERALASNYSETQAQAQALQEQELTEAERSLISTRDELSRRHAQAWSSLLRFWKEACARFVKVNRELAHACGRYFPAWDATFAPQRELPLGLPFGRLQVDVAAMPGGQPRHPQLPLLDLSQIPFPALLPFPERASLLIKASNKGKAAAVRALEALLLRCWTALPPGKVRCTVIDPVGRGENFGAFMHLADHDESLVNGRIWTEPAQITHRLADLTAHMENVLQKYLRNQFATLAEYNAQAAEVAEPFRFLVVSGFPVNFSDDACRRLLSLADAGARCGIYTFVMLDTREPAPPGLDLAELERACTCLRWEQDRFVWEDEDYQELPLQLAASPTPERCTELIQEAGARAEGAARVEVPFARLVPPPEEWWSADARSGLRVPLGRSGARALQLLELGKGTAQHVLIAGKTGSGKSTLLHVLITQVALRFSPREVELYLIDFKKGVEFKSYAAYELPHARVVAVESEREFGLSVLQRLDEELTRRGELYRTHGVTDLAGYRALAAGKELPVLPRVLFIVDEFQEFFVEDDKLAQEAGLLLDRLVRQGRAFGVHVLLGSQTLGGAYSLARSTIDQMAVRIALQCSETDAQLILSRENNEAKLLSRPGEAIYNAAHGLLEGNHLFQIVWLTDDERDQYLEQVRTLAHEREEHQAPLVFEGPMPAPPPPAARRLAGVAGGRRGDQGPDGGGLPQAKRRQSASSGPAREDRVRSGCFQPAEPGRPGGAGAGARLAPGAGRRTAAGERDAAPLAHRRCAAARRAAARSPRAPGPAHGRGGATYPGGGCGGAAFPVSLRPAPRARVAQGGRRFRLRTARRGEAESRPSVPDVAARRPRGGHPHDRVVRHADEPEPHDRPADAARIRSARAPANE